MAAAMAAPTVNTTQISRRSENGITAFTVTSFPSLLAVRQVAS
jgi:hypothetical protein